MSKSSFLKEFKDFAVKGNALDMAVGVIIGGAFGKIVSSIVNDLIMPPIGWLVGGIDFKDLKNYYIIDNHTMNETCLKFNISFAQFKKGSLQLLLQSVSALVS